MRQLGLVIMMFELPIQKSQLGFLYIFLLLLPLLRKTIKLNKVIDLKPSLCLCKIKQINLYEIITVFCCF